MFFEKHPLSGEKNMKLERITESNLRYAVGIQEELFPGESAERNYKDSLEEASPWSII